MFDEIRRILRFESEAVASIPVTEAYERTIDLLYEQIHRKGGKLVVSGMGKAGQIADNIATTFSSTGTPAIFLHPSEAQHGSLGVIRRQDVLLVLSNSGKTREILELITLTHALFSNIPVVVITGNPDSELAQKCDIVIHTGKPDEVCPLGLTPTTSTTIMTVIGDVLVVMLMRKIGFRTEDYAKRHHAGYLGSKSREMSNHENRKNE
ncbi:MAG: SIS domain-containing protein [Bacteroidales bacterium]|nr:SIS domain-containing protein [Bacteroidales bacterium]MBN2698940.1 SIS domain-containing protein [Bacteroidales bacterium]